MKDDLVIPEPEFHEPGFDPDAEDKAAIDKRSADIKKFDHLVESHRGQWCSVSFDNSFDARRFATRLRGTNRRTHWDIRKRKATVYAMAPTEEPT